MTHNEATAAKAFRNIAILMCVKMAIIITITKAVRKAAEK